MLPVCGGVAMASAGMYRSIFFLTKNTGGKKCYTGVFLFFRKKKSTPSGVAMASAVEEGL